MLVLATPLARAVFFGVLLVFGIFLFFPLFWMLSTSLKPEGEIFVRMPTLLPAAPTLVNYANAVRAATCCAAAQQPRSPPVAARC